MKNENQVIELFVGYAHMDRNEHNDHNDQLHMKANSSVTLIKGEKKIILVRLIFIFDKQVIVNISIFSSTA